MVRKKHPVQTKKNRTNKTLFCWAYPEDVDQAHAFYCARYENITWEEFMQLGFFEVSKKLGSIPESEPLHKIIKSRAIEPSKIKDKEERKYWQELKRINQIPQIYLPIKEIDQRLNEFIKKKKGI